MDGEITLSDFVARWKSEGDDWKVYMRVMRHRINKKYRRMLNDLILMKKFLELEYHP
ncbi:hypothetical protein GACE_1580 [Geoglobus acetivorans]|uniref:Uncharacterized protein n=2 Tax=Geoglobus acetivorans TaxID=565033 RepID=A0A0A7GEW3_GEOAI|nr:hypothetical protein GACE_1580 [Geoglobus acetivorans]